MADVPPRPQVIPWQSAVTSVQSGEYLNAAGKRTMRLTIDNGTTRLVCDWTPAELAQLAVNLYRNATGLELADAEELVRLSDPEPIIGGSFT